MQKRWTNRWNIFLWCFIFLLFLRYLCVSAPFSSFSPFLPSLPSFSLPCLGCNSLWSCIIATRTKTARCVFQLVSFLEFRTCLISFALQKLPNNCPNLRVHQFAYSCDGRHSWRRLRERQGPLQVPLSAMSRRRLQGSIFPNQIRKNHKSR